MVTLPAESVISDGVMVIRAPPVFSMVTVPLSSSMLTDAFGVRITVTSTSSEGRSPGSQKPPSHTGLVRSPAQ